MKTKWTTDQDDTLRAEWGKHRCRDIAKGLGVTKMAVIGRAHRLGLEKLKRTDPSRPKVTRLRRRPRWKPEYVPAEIAAVPIGPVAPLNIPFFELGSKHCRFPVSGEGYQMLSCGHTPLEGTSYCAWHGSLTHTVSSGPRPGIKFAWRKRAPAVAVLASLEAA